MTVALFLLFWLVWMRRTMKMREKHHQGHIYARLVSSCDRPKEWKES